MYHDATLSAVRDDALTSVKKASEFSVVSIKDVATAVRRRQKSLASVVHVVLSRNSGRADTALPEEKDLGFVISLQYRMSVD